MPLINLNEAKGSRTMDSTSAENDSHWCGWEHVGEAGTVARLTECDVCGGLAALETVRPIYEGGQLSAQSRAAAIIGMEEDICCPSCGRRTQIIRENANA
jgi:hypothetical protein